MKTIVLLLTTVLFLGPVGCKTTGQDRLDRAATIAGLAAFTGTSVYLAKNPKDRSYFEAARTAIKALIDSENFDPAALASALQKLPINELNGPNGSIYVSVAVVLWDSLAKDTISIDKAKMGVLLKRIYEGFDQAIKDAQARTGGNQP